MKTTFLLSFAFVASMLLTACGGDEGPTLGPFPALTKTEGDADFKLVAPSSKGPGAFTYNSSNPAVATIAGDTVTIVGTGTSTITADQAAVGSYNASHTSAVLTVNPRACILPATRVGTTCTAPATSATALISNSVNWMAVTFADTYANANSFCTTTTINGTKGWRLPTDVELTDLRTTGSIAGHGWTLSRTWSSTVGAAAAQRKTVRLDDGTTASDAETGSAYVACVM
jgi:hypothetical protein